MGSPLYAQYAPSSPQYSSIMSPVGSPTVLMGAPTNVVLPSNPLQAVMPLRTQAQQEPQGVLSVTPEVTKEGDKTEGQGKKTVMVNLGQ